MHHNALCLFLGTGFSKAVTDNKMPGWEQLLKKCNQKVAPNKRIKTTAAIKSQGNEITAGLISAALDPSSLGEVVKRVIEQIRLGNCEGVRNLLTSHAERIKVVTTNYDELVQQIAGENHVSIYPGRHIPMGIDGKLPVYHLHGSVRKPERLVLTEDGYHSFYHDYNYMRSKLYTLLEENIFVIMGYSLNDRNVRMILNHVHKNAQKGDFGIVVPPSTRST